LNDGQAGSRLGCRAIDVVVQKEMNYTYAKLTRTPLITVDNDAKSCFNCILCNVAMMVSQYFGITNKLCSLQSTNLQESKFQIRTAAGDSSETYQHSLDTPVHGTGQGSCASLAIWLLISSFIMDLLEQYANGMELHDIEKRSKIIQRWIDGFVDDNSIFTNLPFGNNNLILLLEKAQHDAQTWEGLLSATGGELKLSKCFYYVLSWKWTKIGSPVPETPSKISI
jgi:hypothetical protein